MMPHGGALIPELDDGVNGSAVLTAAMRDVARAAADARLDVLVVVNPHGLGAEDAHCIAIAPRYEGELEHLRMSALSDRELAERILAATVARDVPAAGVMISMDGQPFPMDWGMFVPMWFLAEAGAAPPAVMIVPSRAYGLESLASLGEAVAEMAAASDERFGIVASADNAHAHQEEGPYGFHPSARAFDDQIVELTRAGRFEDFVSLDPRLIEEALPDSPWQLAVLTGAFRVTPFEVAEVTYDCPSYFGMMVARFAPVS